MKGSTRDILIGIAILVIVLGGIYLLRRPRASVTPTPTPISNFEQKIEDQFNIVIPDDVEKADLKDSNGGDATGVATRKVEGGTFIHTVLADLPDPQPGYFYQGWLIRGKEGEANYSIITTGRMRLAKGGYLLEFESGTDYSDYKTVWVTLERVNDRSPEKRVLEASF